MLTTPASKVDCEGKVPNCAAALLLYDEVKRDKSAPTPCLLNKRQIVDFDYQKLIELEYAGDPNEILMRLSDTVLTVELYRSCIDKNFLHSAVVNIFLQIASEQYGSKSNGIIAGSDIWLNASASQIQKIEKKYAKDAVMLVLPVGLPNHWVLAVVNKQKQRTTVRVRGRE
jgi:hypothetical protein